ncbi:MAG: OmpA family protein, partial [Alphaproteobacteria bacterium]|nr:OmpA family protein [Alphaproteobacteria bacterium]
MKKIGRILSVLLMSLGLAVTVSAGGAQASKFTEVLTEEYFALAQQQWYYSHDKFAVKARAADKGQNVLPYDPAKQKKLAKSRWRSRLVASHDRLMAALKGGFREQNPKQAARAQAMFDCWLWAVIDKDTKCIEKCRKGFLKAMAAWTPPVAAAPPPPPPMAKPAPKPAPPPPPRSFIVFFDCDRAEIRADAQQVIDAAVAYAKRRGFSAVSLTGHADRSGTASYNQGLSARRANAVKAVMVKLGINADGIKTSAYGESAPLVTTADGVREPRNRRVEINF